MTGLPPNLLIRADASARIGTGHVMRMIALAQAWQRRGGRVHLGARELPSSLYSRLQAESIELHRWPEPEDQLTSAEQDAAQTIELADQVNAAVIVADGYHFGEAFQSQIKSAGRQLAIVTDFDYCHRWLCDWIINQNPHSTSESYRSDSSSCRRLLGTNYALLRDEITRHRLAAIPEHKDGTARLLLSLGGSDPDNVSAKLLEQLDGVTHVALKIRVLVGPANRHRESLIELAAKSRHEVTLLEGVADMSSQYLWADGMISAAGSSCWEWMFFGIPAAIVAIADNQRPIYQVLTDKRRATGLAALGQAIDAPSLMHFVGKLGHVSRAAVGTDSFVDGYGAERVAAALDSNIWLRRATSSDKQRYFDWANDPAVRANSLNTEPIAWETHVEWFDHQLQNDNRVLLVAMRDDQPIGQIRFSKTTEDVWEIGFSVDRDARGGGVGKELVRLGVQWMKHHGLGPFIATVKKCNPASAKCFVQLGWQMADDSSRELLHYRSCV